eukprot:2681442-Ditylum_brightwellii.AAC.1
MKGQVDYETDTLFQCWEFGDKDVRNDVDATLIVGLQNKETAQVPKLLFLCFALMIQSSITAKDALELYTRLRVMTGKNGAVLKSEEGLSITFSIGEQVKSLEHVSMYILGIHHPRMVDHSVFL